MKNTLWVPGDSNYVATCGDYLIDPVSIGVIVILISIAKLIEREAVEISSSVNALPLLRFYCGWVAQFPKIAKRKTALITY